MFGAAPESATNAKNQKIRAASNCFICLCICKPGSARRGCELLENLILYREFDVGAASEAGSMGADSPMNTRIFWTPAQIARGRDKHTSRHQRPDKTALDTNPKEV